MENEIKIIPPARAFCRPKKYDSEDLKEYGDSIFYETKNSRQEHTIRDAAYKYAKYHNFKIASRKEKNGIRIYHAGNINN